jgi:hypothetical protein
MEAKIHRLRFIASTTDKIQHQPWYEWLVINARHSNMAGATVFRGQMGFGGSSSIHTAKFWELTEKLPVVVEIIDDLDGLTVFFEQVKPELEAMGKGCIVTIEPVEILMNTSCKK